MEKQTPKQRYDQAMKDADYIRIQGWTTRENAPKIKKYLVTKCGLDASAGEHLIKKGEKRALKPKKEVASN